MLWWQKTRQIKLTVKNKIERLQKDDKQKFTKLKVLLLHSNANAEVNNHILNFLHEVTKTD